MVSGLYTTKTRRTGNNHVESKCANNINDKKRLNSNNNALDVEHGHLEGNNSLIDSPIKKKKRRFPSFHLLLFLVSIFSFFSFLSIFFHWNAFLSIVITSNFSSLNDQFSPFNDEGKLPGEEVLLENKKLNFQKKSHIEELGIKTGSYHIQPSFTINKRSKSDSFNANKEPLYTEEHSVTQQRPLPVQNFDDYKNLQKNFDEKQEGAQTRKVDIASRGSFKNDNKQMRNGFDKENENNVLIDKTTSPSCDVLIFTMDSIDKYVADSKKGGPGGEIIIRKSLMAGLTELYGCRIHVANSDNDFQYKLSFEYINFNVKNGKKKYNLVFVDPWTWAGKGWKVKEPLKQYESRVFILNFFGTSQAERNVKNEWKEIPNGRILTAFNTTPWNTFLGYFYEEENEAKKSIIPPEEHAFTSLITKTKNQGVLWGKDPAHFNEKAKLMILKLAEEGITLHSVVSPNSLLARKLAHPNIHFHGHLTKYEWYKLLDSSSFLLGLGDPLLGPSAVDAIRHGCLYINPVYSSHSPKLKRYYSQHPYLQTYIGKPYVCSAKLGNFEEVKGCIEYAYIHPFEGFIPKDFVKGQYLDRLHEIVKNYI